MALTSLDRDLLKRCLAHKPGAWNDFVDRYLGVIYHVVHHTAHLRSASIKPEDTEDLAAEIQEEAFTAVPFVPTGQFIIPTAYRKGLHGVIVAPVVFLWNVEKE